MVRVCVSDDFRIEDGRLGLNPIPTPGTWLEPEDSGATNLVTPGSWRSLGSNTGLPGLQISRCHTMWTNATPVPIAVHAVLERPSMSIDMKAGSTGEIRGKWSVEITSTPPTSPGASGSVPTPVESTDVIFGHTGHDAPLQGNPPRTIRSCDPSRITITDATLVHPGETITARFGLFARTPQWQSGREVRARIMQAPAITFYRALGE